MPRFQSQPCFLRVGSDTLEDAQFHTSIGDAVAAFDAIACELYGYGQKTEGSIHFVDSAQDEPNEYPDRVLSIGPRGGLLVERT